MRPPPRRLGTIAAACLAGAVVARAPAAQFSYQDLPARYGFPVAESMLLGYVRSDDQVRVRPPFDNYLMCTAYSTMSPRGPDGGLPICFNPYLETDLGATKSYTMDGKTFPADPMAGTRANCRNCHRRAAFPAFDPKVPGSADMGHVYNDGYRAPDDSYFAKLLKVDFLWSIALKNVAP